MKKNILKTNKLHRSKLRSIPSDKFVHSFASPSHQDTRYSRSLNKMDVSIVIPAYSEERYIEKTIQDVQKVLEDGKFKYEIICVIDGLVDRTFEIVSELSKKYPEIIKVYAYSENRGKGFAVRLGFGKAKGKFVGFIDADGQIDEKVIADGLKKLKTTRTDIVVGSKKHPRSNVKYSAFRRFISMLSQIYIKVFFNLGVSDTQAGFKMFRSQVIKNLLPRLTTNRFAFDIEILSVAKYLGFGKIEELPIKVKMLEEDNKNMSKFLLLRDLFKSLNESAIIFKNLRVSKYYDDKNKSEWILGDAPELL